MPRISILIQIFFCSIPSVFTKASTPSSSNDSPKFLPSIDVPVRFQQSGDLLKLFPCESRYCRKPHKKHERFQVAYSPRIQWNDAGGYCGSLAIQNVALGKGVWLSQQQVRDHAKPGGGHDEEILATNVDGALSSLKFAWEQFDYKTEPTPQANAYLGWLKKQLLAGSSVFWMIMLEGGKYPVYPGLPYGFYSHVEPVFGVMTDHDPTDHQWYDDDIIAHGTDAAPYTRFDSLVAGVDKGNRSECEGQYLGYPCVYKKYGFGFAILGPNDNRSDGRPVALSINRHDEPDLRKGQKPVSLYGSLLATELIPDSNPSCILSMDLTHTSIEIQAYDYTMLDAKIHHFKASSTTYAFEDEVPFLSSSATYYRVTDS
eukprot:UC4_evm3s1590